MFLIKNEFVDYYYKVYGLVVKSQIELPELITVDSDEIKNIDVNITYGIMPECVKQSIGQGINYSFEKSRMWFNPSNVGTYFITNGNSIVVEPNENADKVEIKTFLLGSSFGFLLIQREQLAIHGGTILINNKAVIFTGNTGAGKSTMTAAFRERGYSFMADDVSVVGQDGYDVNVVYPAYPQQKLCKDAIKNMGYNPEDFVMVDDDREKYVIPIKDAFIDKPTEIRAIVELSLSEDDNLEISEVIGSEKLICIMKNIYRIEVTRLSGLSREYFRKCLELTNSVSMYKVKRPIGRNTIDGQISIIIDTLNKCDSKVI